MLLILVCWMYIFLTTLNFGFLYGYFFKIEKYDLSIHYIFGLFTYAIITTISAFFIRINVEYYTIILIINILLIFLFYNKVKLHLIKLRESFYNFNLGFKLLYAFLFLISLVQSSTKPYLLDNESYYIQTIKWLNEYGFVKGLANLHMFLGQNSVWHILQAGFNFPFISNNFNDLNGFLLVVMSFLFIEKINKCNHNIQSLNLGLTLLFIVFYLQFVNAPSPDLIIFLITPYLFYIFTEKYKKITTNDFKTLFSLTVFLCFVKVTTVLLLILPLVLYVKHFNHLKKETGLYIILSLVTLVLFISKNSIISGYPLYPLKQFGDIDLDWKVPNDIISFYKPGTHLDSMNNGDDLSLSFFEKLKFWLFLPKLDGLFNKIYFILLITSPFILSKLKNRAPFLIIYLIAVSQFILLWYTSPQYRFFFVFIAFLSIQCISFIIKKEQLKITLIVFATITSAIPIFISINLNTVTNNNFGMKLNTFKIENIIVPEKKSKTITEFTKYNMDGFEFYSPDEDVFFWATGDCDLPCVNKKQIEYFKTYYKYIPELRTKDLKDGFRSKKTN